MIRRLALAILLLAGAAYADDFTTDYEKSGFTDTPRYEETVAYCKRLAKASSMLRYTTFGETPQGRDLPLVIANKNGRFDPARARRPGDVVLLVQAGIHSGEIDGKDAGLMLLRDIAVTGKYPGLLDHVTVLFIPIFNVDGHERFGPYNRINQNGPREMGWRTTAQNLNLNRDYLKADAPEMQAWLRLYNAWLPEFFIDCHVTDGADYQYVLTYVLDIFGNMPPPVTQWTRDVFLAEMRGSLGTAGYDLIPYVFMREWGNPKAGLISWVASPRFSNGYTAIRNRPGLLLETHMLKDYKTRVDGTYEVLRQTLEILNREHDALAKAVAEADAFAASPAMRAAPYPVEFTTTDEPATIDFKGVAYETVESDVSGGPWYKFDGTPQTYPVEFFAEQRATDTVELPEAYIIPPEWTDVIERLERHDIDVRRLERPVTLSVRSYRFEAVTWPEPPFEGRHMPAFEPVAIEAERRWPAGSVVVDMNQRFAAVAAHILEPIAPDSYVRWGFFNVIFEQKEGYSGFVMERLARKMLADDPALAGELEQWKAENPELASQPKEILDWFYRRTPYWDERKDVYPVGKLTDRKVVEGLPTR